jgi:branched-chain amino acid transport system ATP-binding protein
MPLLEVRNLTKRFGGLVAVNDVSFSIEPHEIRGLIGPNGSGKSTTMNMLAGLYRPSGGDILYQGKSIVNLQPYQRVWKGIMRTFQIPKLFRDMTVLDNMLVPALATAPQKTPEGFGKILAQTEERLKFSGLDHIQHLQAKQISGGQSMLLQIARGLMANGLNLFLMDEPFAGINQTIKDTIMDAILEMNEKHGITFLIVSHEMPSIRRLCQKISVMHEGSLIAEGNMEEVANNPQVIEAYLGASHDDADH